MPKPLISTGGCLQVPGALAAGHDHRAGAVAAQAAIEQPERRRRSAAPRDTAPCVSGFFICGVGIAQRVLAEGHRDLRRTGRGSCRRDACGGVRRSACCDDRAEIAVFRARSRCGSCAVRRRSFCARASALGMRARPGIAAIAADHRGREPGLDRHRRQAMTARIWLAPPLSRLVLKLALMPSRAPPADDGNRCRPARADDAVHVLVGEAGLVQRVLDRLFQEASEFAPDLAEPAFAGADDGVFVPQRIHARLSNRLRPARSFRRSRRGSTSSRSAGISLT